MQEMQRRIRFELDRMPIVDVHSHLGTRGLWQARHLADILSYHWVQVELARAAGHTFTRDLDPADYVAQVLPHIPAIRNTVNHYALLGILRDLYGLADRTLTAENWRAVDEAVRSHHQEAAWFGQVLQRAGVERVAVCYSEGRPHAGGDFVPGAMPEFIPYENAEYLYAVDRPTALHKIVGPGASLPLTPERLHAAIAHKVDQLAQEHHIRALHVCPYPSERYPGWSYQPSDKDQVESALQRVLHGEDLPPQERRQLINFTAEATSAAAAKHGLVIQMFHGSVAHTRENTNEPNNMSYWDPEFLQTHTRLFAQYRDTTYDIFLGTRIPSHEAVMLARAYFNVLVSGAWWHAFSPTTMRIMFRDRLELLPTTAWNAFFSDGYLVEWVYGKQLVTKNVLSLALAEMVDEGYITEQDAIDIAAQVLYRTPLATYKASG